MSYTRKRANPKKIIAGFQKVFKQVSVKFVNRFCWCGVYIYFMYLNFLDKFCASVILTA